jgi:hypothetical protein
MLLIDDRTPPPSEPERPIWEPDWRLVGWVVVAVAAAVAAFLTPGILSFALICASLACAGHAAASWLPYGDGLREYRQ